MNVNFKVACKFDISAYKLVRMSDKFKKMRGPYELQKTRLGWEQSSYFVWDLTHYDDEKLIGTRVISHYHVNTRSLVFK